MGVQLQHTQYQSSITVEEACIEYASLYPCPGDYHTLLEQFGLTAMSKSLVAKLSVVLALIAIAVICGTIAAKAFRWE